VRIGHRAFLARRADLKLMQDGTVFDYWVTHIQADFGEGFTVDLDEDLQGLVVYPPHGCCLEAADPRLLSSW